MTAVDLLLRASDLMAERGKQYDKPEGERSMAGVMQAFNAITGRDLTEQDGWLIMLLLKMKRQWQNPNKAHQDSLEDAIAYAALLGESYMCSTPSGTSESITGE